MSLLNKGFFVLFYELYGIKILPKNKNKCKKWQNFNVSWNFIKMDSLNDN